MPNGFLLEEYTVTEDTFTFKLKYNDALEGWIEDRANAFRRDNPKVTFKGFRCGKEPVELIIKNWG